MTHMTPDNEKLWLLSEAILNLTVDELRELNQMISDEGGEPIGVREPRRPSPESPGDEIALEEDDD